MDISVRTASERDASALSELNREWNGDYAPDEQQTALLLHNNSEIVMLATLGGEAIGFICGRIVGSICHKSLHGEITELFVSKKFRQRGAARALITSMEDYFIENSVKVVTLSTAAANTTAQSCYQSCGYLGKPRIEYRKVL